MEHIRIGHTDVVLQELGGGRGKIIISDDEYGYNFSYYWGSMGKDSLKQFIKSVDTGYFVKKLNKNVKGPLNNHKTFVKLRAYIRESLQYELPWYQEMEFQKHFREELRILQKSISCENEFIDKISIFCDEINFYIIKDERKREIIKNLFKNIFSIEESWSFIENNVHPEDIFLTKLHKKLKDKLSKPVQLCLF